MPAACQRGSSGNELNLARGRHSPVAPDPCSIVDPFDHRWEFSKPLWAPAPPLCPGTESCTAARHGSTTWPLATSKPSRMGHRCCLYPSTGSMYLDDVGHRPGFRGLPLTSNLG